jgi:mannose-1-phosphate guanylyltransferase
MNKNHYVAIMAGGIGSRFWPMSRTGYPKQFLDILHVGKTLIQSTYEHFSQFIPPDNIYVVTAEPYINFVKEQLPQLPEENILAEPSRKNTAPCIAYITYKLMQINPAASLICAPSDHLILDTIAFNKVCLEALDFVAKNNALLSLGIKPHSPNTGYGYIQYEQHAVNDSIYKVKTFTEKPDLELAKAFIQSGDFLWNAGIFISHVKNLVHAFERYLPEIHDVFYTEREQLNTTEEKEVIERIYPQCTSISFDYGVMEKADNVYVIPSSFGWSDLGTWATAYDCLEKDYLDNAVTGSDHVIVFDTEKCMINAPQNKLLVIQGLEEYIVVDTNDVLLICRKDKEQEIKEYVAEVKRNKGDKYL